MSAKKERSDFPPETLAAYDRLIETVPNLERKGAKVPYTSLNGHMFSFIGADGALGIRLPPEARDAFLQKYNTRLCESYGIVLKEYVAVPAEMLDDIPVLSEYFGISYAYVKAMKPKASKKGGSQKDANQPE
jgi:hypothetical protein